MYHLPKCRSPTRWFVVNRPYLHSLSTKHPGIWVHILGWHTGILKMQSATTPYNLGFCWHTDSSNNTIWIASSRVSILFVDTLIHQRKRVWHIGSPKMSWSVKNIEIWCLGSRSKKRTKEQNKTPHKIIEDSTKPFGPQKKPGLLMTQLLSSFVVPAFSPRMSCNGACQSCCPIRLDRATSSRPSAGR